jgi:ribosome-binding factor A
MQRLVLSDFSKHRFRQLCYAKSVNTSGIRAKRIAGTVRKHLSSELAREVADPRLAALAIEEVEVSADLSLARVKVRLMFGGETRRARDEAMAALLGVSPSLRASLAPVLRMRRVPELRFEYDEGQDMREEIDAVLAEIKREDEEKKRRLGLTEDSEDQS